MPMPLIEARGLSKSFDGFVALHSIDLVVEPGEIFALVGSNGAGKTTTLRLLTGMLRPTSGWAQIDGINVTADPLAIKRRIGYLPEAPPLYDKLTGLEFLNMIARIRDLDESEASARVTTLVRILDLEDRITVQIGNYSRGMKQKLAFAATIVHRPRVMVLDEPTSGLDPRYSKLIKEWIRAQADEGTAVIISSHITGIIEALCTKIIIMHRGKVIATGTPASIFAQTGTDSIEDAFVTLIGESEWTGL